MAIHLRAPLRPPASSSGMIEVDVGDEDMPNVLFIQPKCANAIPQLFERRARSGLDQYQTATRLDHIGGDQPRRVLKMQVECVDDHGSIDNGFILDLHAIFIQRG